MELELTNKILENNTYRSRLEMLELLEKDRIFCCHGIEHFLSVARIALIICRERGIEASPDLIYSASLLHDIGRIEEYTQNVSHEKAGIRIASQILDEVSCDSSTKKQIISIIGSHGHGSSKKDSLENVFFTADKKSRNCFMCSARSECNWDKDKMNMKIEV